MRAGAIVLLLSLLPSAPAIGEADPPALMHAATYSGEADVSRYWVSEKLDGVRGYWTGERLLTRGGHAVDPPAWFVAGWPGVAMDGELWMGRGRFAEVSGVVRTREPVAAEWHQVRFMVFDLPAHGGTFTQRVHRMRQLLAAADIAWLRPVEQFRLQDAEAVDARLEAVVEAGGEGLMLHHEAATRQTGRSEALRKYKPHQDAEAVVVAHTAGRGRYAGMLGALVVERPDGSLFRLGTGFTDAERADPPPIGSRVTYRHNGFTTNGIPRFARFLRVRPPLSPASIEDRAREQ